MTGTKQNYKYSVNAVQFLKYFGKGSTYLNLKKLRLGHFIEN
jgi:hypothetical protein